jgi:hypothetical protein
VSYALDLGELHLFGVFRFVLELPEHKLLLTKSVLFLYFVPLILGIFLVGFACLPYTPCSYWMFFITVDTFDVIISNFPATVIS